MTSCQWDHQRGPAVAVGLQEDSSTMAALPLFQAQAQAVQAGEGPPLEPGLAALLAHVESTSALLLRHASDLRACLQVSPCHAISNQTIVSLRTAMERLQVLGKTVWPTMAN